MSMPARQLRLFDHPKPLLTRLGANFFKAVPAAPGVYLMFNEAERLLYVGHSADLRTRLGSYKNANPDHLPRKVLRLVHCVASIRLETCETLVAARLRENELLQTHRPRFNRMHTWPKAYWFVGCEERAERLRLWLTTDDAEPAQLHGAFKGNTRAAFGALLRGLYRAASASEVPAGLLSPRPPRHYEVSLDESLRPPLQDFLTGASSDLLRRFRPMDDSAFFALLHAHDQELLTRFFERGPVWNRCLRERFALPPGAIPQQELNALSIRCQGDTRRSALGPSNSPCCSNPHSRLVCGMLSTPKGHAANGQ